MPLGRRDFISSILGGAVALVLAPFIPKASTKVRDAAGRLQGRQYVDTYSVLAELPQAAEIKPDQVPYIGVKTMLEKGMGIKPEEVIILTGGETFARYPEVARGQPCILGADQPVGSIVWHELIPSWPPGAMQLIRERKAKGDHTVWIFANGLLRDSSDHHRVLASDGTVRTVRLEEEGI